MDEFMKNIYGNNTDSTSSFTQAQQPRVICPTGSIGVVIPDNNRGSVMVASNEVWRESEMRLEDFLRKTSNGAGSIGVRRRGNESDDVRLTPVPPPQQHLSLPSGHRRFEVTSSAMINGGQYGRQGQFGLEGLGIGGVMGRAKRRIVTEESVMDKATQQKQRRMIKNRESAARSRERKQARTTELESLVAQLQVKNAELVREEAHQKKERLKKIMEMVIPVVEKRRPRKVLRRVMSSGW